MMKLAQMLVALTTKIRDDSDYNDSDGNNYEDGVGDDHNYDSNDDNDNNYGSKTEKGMISDSVIELLQAYKSTLLMRRKCRRLQVCRYKKD